MSNELYNLLVETADLLTNSLAESKKSYESIYNTNPEPITDTEISNWLMYFTNNFPKYTFKLRNVTEYSITFNTNIPPSYNLAPYIVWGGNDESSTATIFVRPLLRTGSMYVTLTKDMQLKPIFS